MQTTERVRIFVNEKARSQQKRNAEKLKRLLGNTGTIHPMTFPAPELPSNVKTVVSIGGDGTFRALTDSMMRREDTDPGVVVATRGGSENSFHMSLQRTGENTLLPVDIADAHEMDLRHFHPAEVNGQTFTIVAEKGASAITWSQRNEKFRKLPIPRGLRSHIVAFLSGLQHAGNGNQPIIELYFVGGVIKDREVLPQKLFSDDITKVTIGAMSKRRFTTFSGRLAARIAARKPIADLLEIQTAQQFTEPRNGMIFIGMGGDLVHLENGEDQLVIKRSEDVIVPAALVFKPRRLAWKR